MIRTISLVVAALMIGLLSASAQSQEPANVTEDYLLLQIHRNFAKRMVGVWDNMWMWCGGGSSVDSSRWVDHKTIDVNQNGHIMRVGFTALGYDPQLSTFDYGKPTANVNEQTITGHDYIYDLSEAQADGEFKQTDEVTLDRERSVSVSHGVVMNASVSSETKIAGKYAGIDLEETIKAEFGIQKSSETQKAQSESKSVTEAHEFSIPLPAGEITRIYLTTGDTHQSREVTLNAVADWTVEFYLVQPCTFAPTWWYSVGQHVLNKNNPQVTACWNTNYPGSQSAANQGWGHQFEKPCKVTIPLDEIDAALTGKHADWQGLVGLWDKLYSTTRANVNAALDPANRHINVSGTEDLVFDHEIVQKVETVSSDDVDNLVADGAKSCDPESSTC